MLNQGRGRSTRRSWEHVHPALNDHHRTRTGSDRSNRHDDAKADEPATDPLRALANSTDPGTDPEEECNHNNRVDLDQPGIKW
ncbi:unnamed protein product [Merluccius merluccius]